MKVSELLTDSLEEGVLNDIVKGVKRQMAGKPSRDDLANRHLRKAGDMFKQASKAGDHEKLFKLARVGDKELSRYNKVLGRKAAQPAFEERVDELSLDTLNSYTSKKIKRRDADIKAGNVPSHDDAVKIAQNIQRAYRKRLWAQSKEDQKRKRKDPLAAYSDDYSVWSRRDESIEEGLFDKKSKPKLHTRELTDDERKLIKKYVPSSNIEMKNSSGHLFPKNAHGYRGIGRITFYTEDDVLMASVGLHSSEDDASNPRKSPLKTVEVSLKSEDDFKKIAKMVDA